MNKRHVKAQFGPAAADYAISGVHAMGESLARLIELTRPQADWQVLDVATGAGHTALAFAPHVTQVTATDITPQMLDTAVHLAQERTITNLTLIAADAENLPYSDHSFDLVTCRLAAHHFPRVQQFLAEAARVLRHGGLLALADNVVPGSRLRGKKAKRLRQAGAYINAFEKLRDPSHHRCLSLDEWEDGFGQAGFAIQHRETLPMWLDFDDYAERMRVSPINRVRLRAMLWQAPELVADFFRPQSIGARINFRLTEAILIGKL